MAQIVTSVWQAMAEATISNPTKHSGGGALGTPAFMAPEQFDPTTYGEWRRPGTALSLRTLSHLDSSR